MKATVVVYVVVAAFFGLMVGYLIGYQQGAGRSPSAPPTGAAAQPAATAPTAKAIDETQVAQLRADAQRDATDPRPRASLGNLYYDAERFDEAAKWYEEALRLNPKDINISTDLGVSYWNLNQPDRALQQFDQSLAIDPRHPTTLLNQGIVRAFGKQDLQGAAQSWQKVIEIDPASQQAQTAKRMLDGLKQAHPEVSAAQPAGATKK